MWGFVSAPRPLIPKVPFPNRITDPDNWLDLVYISIIYTWTSVMATQALDDVFFQRCSAILVLVYTWKLLSFLKSILFGFAVFIGGISFVMRRLMAFSLSLIIILVAFALIFSTLFRMSEGCKDYATDPYGVLLAEQFTYGVYAPVYAYVDPCDGAADAGDPSSDPLGECRYVTSCEPTLGGSIPFCSQLTSWTKMWYMLSGSVDEKFFHDRLGNRLATVYFAIFMFLCVIVLANVLIAIVTDSWAVIQNERSGEWNVARLEASVEWSTDFETLELVPRHDSRCAALITYDVLQRWCFGLTGWTLSPR